MSYLYVEFSVITTMAVVLRLNHIDYMIYIPLSSVKSQVLQNIIHHMISFHMAHVFYDFLQCPFLDPLYPFYDSITKCFNLPLSNFYLVIFFLFVVKIIMHILCPTPTLAKAFLLQFLFPKSKFRVSFFL